MNFDDYEVDGQITMSDFVQTKNDKKGEKEMELKINEVQLPSPITFNYDELKAELTEKVSMYTSLVYTEENIKDAKADRAGLNKLKKALNDERIRREKEYMVPFNDFKAKINEIIGIIDKPVAIIDRQIKEFEERQKQDKLAEIEQYFTDSVHPEWLRFEQIFDEKWLNTSVAVKAVQDAIEAKISQTNSDIHTLENLPEFGFEACEVYKSTLDMNKAISEGHRLSEIQKRKAEAEAEQARIAAEAEFSKNMNSPVVEETPAVEETVAEEKTWISFAALLSTEDALALKEFFESRRIQFKAV